MKAGIEMRNILMVGLGGFFGSVLRYLVSGWAHALFKNSGFPLGTAVVNIAGCLAIGFLGGWAQNLQTFHAATRMFLLIGLLGGFTTFSTFSYETLALLQDGQAFSAFANIGIQVVLGLAAAWLGYGLSNVL